MPWPGSGHISCWASTHLERLSENDRDTRLTWRWLARLYAALALLWLGLAVLSFLHGDTLQALLRGGLGASWVGLGLLWWRRSRTRYGPGWANAMRSAEVSPARPRRSGSPLRFNNACHAPRRLCEAKGAVGHGRR